MNVPIYADHCKTEKLFYDQEFNPKLSYGFCKCLVLHIIYAKIIREKKCKKLICVFQIFFFLMM